MTATVYIKKGSYGMIYQFTFENVDYSAYSGKGSGLFVWSNSTQLISASCSMVYSNPDTVVSYTVLSGDFDTAGDYDAEIIFTRASFREKSDTFVWIVEETAST